MDITLTPDLEAFVANKISHGGFESPSDLVSQALELLRERERQLAELRGEIKASIDELDRGEGKPLNMQSIKDKVLRTSSPSALS